MLVPRVQISCLIYFCQKENKTFGPTTKFKYSTMLRMHNSSGVKVMTFNLLWSSLAPGDTGCGCRGFILAESGRGQFFVLSWADTELRPLDPEAGGQSVTRSGPRRTCEARVARSAAPGVWCGDQDQPVKVLFSPVLRQCMQATCTNMRHDT